MEHPFAYRTHYNPEGEVCHCPWGIAPGHEHLGATKEASKLEWLEDPEKRPEFHDKNHKEYARNHTFLTYLKDMPRVDEFDKLIPWMHREYKKGRLLPNSGKPWFHYKENGEPWSGDEPNVVKLADDKHPFAVTTPYAHEQTLGYGNLADWQNALDEMKRRGKGVDLMQHKVHELAPKIKDFEAWKKEQDRKDLGEVLHRFDDGWTIRRLQNAAEHEDEGREMGHCIGGDRYSNATEKGNAIYASLRDHRNEPHASIQLHPDHWKHAETGEISPQHPGPTPADGWIPQVGPTTEAGEFYGKQDRAPEPEYEERVNEWLARHGAPAAHGGSGGPPEADWVTLPAAESVEDYNALHSDYGSPWEVAEEISEQPVGENTELEHQEPYWTSITENWLDGRPVSPEHKPEELQYGQKKLFEDRNYTDNYGPHPIARQRFYDALLDNGHAPAFEEEARHLIDENPLVSQQQKLRGLQLWGEYMERKHDWELANRRGYRPMGISERADKPMFMERENYEPQFNRYDPRMMPNRPPIENPSRRHVYDEHGNMIRTPVYGPEQQQWKYPVYNPGGEIVTYSNWQEVLPENAHYNNRGEICYCSWGIPFKRQRTAGVVKESAKLDWLKSRPDMQTPEGQRWLRYLEGYGRDRNNEEVPPETYLMRHKYADADKLLDYLTREWKKGRMFLPEQGGTLPANHPLVYVNPEPPNFNPGHYWAEYGNGRRINLATFDNPEQARTYAQPWEEQFGGLKGVYPGALESFPHAKAIEVANLLDEMQRRGKGVDLMSHKGIHTLLPKIEEYKDWLKAKERDKSLGEVIHKLPDGWTIRQLHGDDELEDEGQEMGNCVGTREHGTPQRVENGESIIASLRDKNNLPRATIEMTPDHTDEQGIPRVGPSSITHQFYSKGNSQPPGEHQDRVNNWLEQFGIKAKPGGQPPPHPEHEEGWDDEDEEEEPQEDEEYVVPGAEDVSDFLGYLTGEYMDRAYEDPHANIGENTNVWMEAPNYPSIARDYFWHSEPHYDSTRREVFDRARQEEHLKDFEESLYATADEEDKPLLEEWEKWKEPYYHPLTGQFTEGYLPGGNVTPLQQHSPTLFTEMPEQLRGPQRPDGGPYGVYQGPLTAPYVNWQEDPVRNRVEPGHGGRYTSTKKPLYHRWIFSPSKGVTLGTNADAHPALVKYHQGLGGDINDTDLSHGYAYPIGNGWRITDYEHQPVDDPFIVNAVVRRLNLEGGPQIRSEGRWQATEYDWSRLHYGLPKEKTNPL